jgi:NNP family nitrate/nitrite transporter-like MFS transporter
MPLVFSGFLALGLTKARSWRASMLAAGVVCLLTGIAYFFLTQDTPTGNFKELRDRGDMPARKYGIANFFIACADYRVWLLFLIYAACFGIELTIDNTAHLYFSDNFKLDLEKAGMVAAILGGMNLFARSVGGIIADRCGRVAGLRGRVRWLFVVLLAEGICMIVFSRMTATPLAIGSLLLFGMCVDMSCGATYSVVPFINKKSLGSVSGIVGAGGNVGAVLAGFLFKGPTAQWSHSLLVLGIAVMFVSFAALGVKFSAQDELSARQEIEDRLGTATGEFVPAAA